MKLRIRLKYVNYSSLQVLYLLVNLSGRLFFITAHVSDACSSWYCRTSRSIKLWPASVLSQICLWGSLRVGVLSCELFPVAIHSLQIPCLTGAAFSVKFEAHMVWTQVSCLLYWNKYIGDFPRRLGRENWKWPYLWYSVFTRSYQIIFRCRCITFDLILLSKFRRHQLVLLRNCFSLQVPKHLEAQHLQHHMNELHNSTISLAVQTWGCA